MNFDRYAILTKHYEKEIRSWNWNYILKNLAEYEPEGFNPEHDDRLVGKWLGTHFGLYPSGKVYAPWTTNQTRSDMIKDECFNDALEQVAASYGLFLDHFDGSVFVVKVVEENELSTENS